MAEKSVQKCICTQSMQTHVCLKERGRNKEREELWSFLSCLSQTERWNAYLRQVRLKASKWKDESGEQQERNGRGRQGGQYRVAKSLCAHC